MDRKISLAVEGFTTSGCELTLRDRSMLPKRMHWVYINPDRFDKLITALRTAVDNDGMLDKESTSYNDIFDAFRLAQVLSL